MNHPELISPESLNESFNAIESPNDDEIHHGFSVRLNQFFDVTGMVPTKGRGKFVSIALGATPAAVSTWLNNDKVPSTNTLTKMVLFFLKESEKLSSADLKNTLSWLRYGESATPFPFNTTNESSEKVIARTLEVIANSTKQLGLTIKDYDLKSVINQTQSLFENLGITTEEDIDDIHITTIKVYIKESSENKT